MHPILFSFPSDVVRSFWFNPNNHTLKVSSIFSECNVPSATKQLRDQTESLLTPLHGISISFVFKLKLHLRSFVKALVCVINQILQSLTPDILFVMLNHDVWIACGTKPCWRDIISSQSV